MMTGGLARRPPLGWNSFDCYGAAVVEAEVRANAEWMARNLKAHGWEYVVVDFCWSHPLPGSQADPHQDEYLVPRLAIDGYGRLVPARERFPSAVDGAGFAPLAGFVHSLGLKFGIHIMRGIPRQAVAANLPVLGCEARAAGIADRTSDCTWLNHMWGVNMGKPGAQAYYDSLFALYASWGVDFVKVDDMLAGSREIYHEAEIEAVPKAAAKCGRPMVLSFSPGAAPLRQAGHLKRSMHMWRISGDFWDDWKALRTQFDLARDWARFTGPGAWADADMLPLGRLSKRGPMGAERWTNFTPDEQVTLMTLWLIFRSPLMMGGNMPENDVFTTSLLTNDEALAVGQEGSKPVELFRRGEGIAWVSGAPRKGRYLALFNTGEGAVEVEVEFSELGLKGPCRVRDLWKRGDLGSFGESFEALLPAHGSGLYLVQRAGK